VSDYAEELHADLFIHVQAFINPCAHDSRVSNDPADMDPNIQNSECHFQLRNEPNSNGPPYWKISQRLEFLQPIAVVENSQDELGEIALCSCGVIPFVVRSGVEPRPTRQSFGKPGRSYTGSCQAECSCNPISTCAVYLPRASLQKS